MKDSKLDPALRKLREDLEDRSVVATASPAATRDDARVFDHDVLEIRRRNPDAPLGPEHGLHDLLVVISVGENTKRDGARHPERVR